MARSKNFEEMDARPGNGARAAQDVLRSRMGSPTSIPLDQLQPNPDNPRYDYDDPETVQLAETMREVGQLQAALVIPRENWALAYPDRVDELEPEPWVVLVGNRRLAAAPGAGRGALDVKVNRDLQTAEAIEDRVLIENIQRKDLPPLLEAERLQRRLRRPGQTTRTVGQAIGKSHTYVAQRVALLGLIQELQDLIRAERLDIKTARWLGTRPSGEQREALAAAAPALAEGKPFPSRAARHSPPTEAGNRVYTPGGAEQSAAAANPAPHLDASAAQSPDTAESEAAAGHGPRQQAHAGAASTDPAAAPTATANPIPSTAPAPAPVDQPATQDAAAGQRLRDAQAAVRQHLNDALVVLRSVGEIEESHLLAGVRRDITKTLQQLS